ncbi:PqqD family protein [bacterium]|nr:MAG: PqqD family protein [bacterium]
MFGKREKKKNEVKRAIEVNLLDLVPRRIARFEVDEETHLVTIIAPKFKNKWMKKIFEPRLKTSFLKIKLDEIGSSVWMLCDGEKNIKEIGEILRERFHEKIEPCYERLNLFFKQLEEVKFVQFTNLDECLKESGFEDLNQGAST